ncbi:MAG TPA: Crp/Fnr family transcriptional regulator [Patescibacteria group bacterium]|nr:Crp/Fnr family transcriptional regulator [Patescibacteria group bacterium]
MAELEDYLNQLSKNCLTKKYPKDQTLIYEEDKPTEVLILNKGIIKIFDKDNSENEKILHLVKPMSIIPFSIFSGGKRINKWCYSALTDCQVAVIPLTEFLDYMNTNVDFTMKLINWFSIEVHELLVRLSSLGKTTAQDKIISALKFLAVYNSKKLKNNWVRIKFNVSHQLLADMTGVTRERAAVIMKELANSKFINYPKQNILDLNLNQLLRN